MIPTEVADMRDEMISAGIPAGDALALAWKFYHLFTGWSAPRNRAERRAFLKGNPND